MFTCVISPNFFAVFSYTYEHIIMYLFVEMLETIIYFLVRKHIKPSIPGKERGTLLYKPSGAANPKDR